MGWLIATAGFWGATAGTTVMVAGMALMYLAPVQSLAFRSRFKLNLIGVVILVVSVGMMVLGAALIWRGVSAADPSSLT